MSAKLVSTSTQLRTFITPTCFLSHLASCSLSASIWARYGTLSRPSESRRTFDSRAVAAGRFPQVRSAMRAALYAERVPTKEGEARAKTGKARAISHAPSQSAPRHAQSIGRPGTLA